MNYIKRLEQDLRQANEDKAAALEALNDLQRYLLTPKFTGLGAGDRFRLVNIEDVLARISPAISATLP